MLKEIELQIKKLEEELSKLPTEKACKDQIQEIKRIKQSAKTNKKILLEDLKTKSKTSSKVFRSSYSQDSKYCEFSMSMDGRKIQYRLDDKEALLVCEFLKSFLNRESK